MSSITLFTYSFIKYEHQRLRHGRWIIMFRSMILLGLDTLLSITRNFRISFKFDSNLVTFVFVLQHWNMHIILNIGYRRSAWHGQPCEYNHCNAQCSLKFFSDGMAWPRSSDIIINELIIWWRGVEKARKPHFIRFDSVKNWHKMNDWIIFKIDRFVDGSQGESVPDPLRHRTQTYSTFNDV